MKQIVGFLSLTMAAQMILPLSAQAQDRCLRDTQLELTECYHERYSAADQDLNKAFEWVLEALATSETEAENIRVAQRAWIAFRDADCHFQGLSARGGSLEPMLIGICLLERTETRTSELLEILNGIRSR